VCVRISTRLQALHYLELAAKQGDATAQVNLGVMLLQNDTEDASAAVEWLRSAAEQGHPGAESQLGTCYKRGKGVEASNKTAAMHWRRAAEAGDVEGMHNLGVVLQTGSGEPQDNATAHRWFQKAAELGQQDAMFACSQVWMERGENVTALGWLVKAALMGQLDAMNGYAANLKEGGLGLEPNPVDAVDWFRNCAEAGHGGCMHNLAVCYEHGHGVAVDHVASTRWATLAVQHGVGNSITAF
jgi:TPR repeat protein